ncbi:membrane protein [Bacilli bacterium]|nr:membrane protein [Bacilli bacterium]GHU43010.1 membrane protein [Bacilli bacterium]
MKSITEICELLILAMSTVAVLVLICGVVKATVKFVKNEVSHADKASVLRIIKNELGAYVLFSLEILIAADIVESIIKPTFEDIGKLAALVVIRTVISYFLGKEIDQEIESR